ncbi:T9SS type A sorting domain-containing protein [bacterium]|nr:T9SS type A sorting domain-containing protein [bacterium]
MERIRHIVIAAILLSTWLCAQPAGTEIATVEDHNDWGWTSIVQKNDLITLATVPAIGARIMQYDLGDHQFMYVNSFEIGKTYTPAAGSVHSYGGYVMWPAPQYRWPGTWPPPPVLDYGTYTSEIVADTPDSNCVAVTGGTEKWVAPDIRFERKMTIYRGTTRVRLEQSIINESSETRNWSIWDVTQTIAKNPRDNYWVYFAINPDSEFGEDGVYFRNNQNSEAWTGEVAPGIYGVVFRPEGKKLFADTHQGWIAYVDEGEGKAYIKTFPIFEGADYPGDNGGGRVQVYLGGAYYEVEVASPMVDLEPNGGRYTFIHNWYLTTLNGPILSANSIGASAERLYRDSSTGHLKGIYGVFYTGFARIRAVDASGTVLSESDPVEISPMGTWNIDMAMDMPDQTDRVKIVVSDAGGTEIGDLESITPDQLTAVHDRVPAPGSLTLTQNYPNPFNPETAVAYTLSDIREVRLCVYDINGRLLSTLVHERQPAGSYTVRFNGKNLESGIYLVRLETGDQTITRRMVLLK